jgi:hypothetical protein
MKEQELGWVLPIIIERKKGISVGALIKQKQRSSGGLIEGVHWKKAMGRVWFHYEKYNEIIENAA